jgi:hypothetical protein
VDFFEDDATTQAPPRPPRRERSKSARRRTRIQRLIILIVVLFLIVFGLALWIRSCQHSHKVSAYRTYFGDVAAAIKDSETLGQQLSALLASPTKYSGTELKTKLDNLRSTQLEIDQRVKHFSVPGKLKSQQTIFERGMDVRLAGFTQFNRALETAISKQKTVSAATLAAFGGYFTGPDAYYTTLFYTQARKIMQADGVTDVTVPTSTYFTLHSDVFSKTHLASVLAAMKVSTRVGGIHGVALISVVAQPANVRLTKGFTVTIKADVNLAFTVTVQNQGSTTETNVPVSVTFTPPGGAQPQKKSSLIASIAASKSASVDIGGFTGLDTAISQVSTLKVMAGPVPGEKILTNNSATYKITLTL